MISRQEFMNRRDPRYRTLERRCDAALEDAITFARSPHLIEAEDIPFTTVVALVEAYSAAGWRGKIFITNGDAGVAIRFDI